METGMSPGQVPKVIRGSHRPTAGGLRVDNERSTARITSSSSPSPPLNPSTDLLPQHSTSNLSPSSGLRPSLPPSPASSTFSSISDHEYLARAPDHDPASNSTRYDELDPNRARSSTISHARKGSASSGRLLQLGSVYSLSLGDEAGTPTAPFSAKVAGYRIDGEAGEVLREASLGMGVGETGERGNRGMGASTTRRSLNPSSARGYHRGSATSNSTPSDHARHSNINASRDSVFIVAPNGVSTLPFPSPPARSSYHSHLPPSLHPQSTSPSQSPVSTPEFQPTPPLPPTDTTISNLTSMHDLSHHGRTIYPTASGSVQPDFDPLPTPSEIYSTISTLASASPTIADRTRFTSMSTNGLSPSDAEHTFGHDTSSAPTSSSQVNVSGPGRLSAYDPLAGEISDIASYGSTIPTPEISPKSFNSHIRGPIGTVRSGMMDQQVFANSSKQLRIINPSPTRTRSTKSTKSSKSSKSYRSGRSRSGLNKRGSAGSLAFRLADLSWTLRSDTPDIGEEEGLLDDDYVDSPGRKKRRSARSVLREEQNLDLARLLGRAAVLEKILRAGKRVSNQSLKHRSLRATDSPMPIPPIPPYAFLPHPPRRPFSLQSIRTNDTSASHSTSTPPHDTPPLPPLPPVPASRPPGRSSLSGSIASSFGQARLRIGKRVKRDGEWGGDGYTSLRGSEEGRGVEGMAGEGISQGVVIVSSPVEASPPVPPKPAYLGWKSIKADSSYEKSAGCLGDSIYGPGEIMLPPNCLCIGSRRSPVLRDSPPISRGTEYRPERPRVLHRQLSGILIDDTGHEPEKVRNRQPPPAPSSPRLEDQIINAGRRRSRVMSYVSTGQASSRSRRRWIIWIGVGCAVGLGVVGGILVGVLTGRKRE